jgi:hypothetical protein
MRRAPFNDPIPDASVDCGESESREVPDNSRMKTTVRWPPMWLIPLVEYAWRNRGPGGDKLEDT